MASEGDRKAVLLSAADGDGNPVFVEAAPGASPVGREGGITVDVDAPPEFSSPDSGSSSSLSS